MKTQMKYTVALVASARAFDLGGLIGGAIGGIAGGAGDIIGGITGGGGDIISNIADSVSQFVPGNGQKYWRSGNIATREKFKYGKFIARIKGDDKKGTVSSFFTYWTGPGWYRGGWSEIDVELVPSSSGGTVSTNLIW